MTTTQIVAALEKKYRELAAELAAVETQVGQIRSEAEQLDSLERRAREISQTIVHMETSIRLFREDWTPPPPSPLHRRRTR